jgi:hypothetical protein
VNAERDALGLRAISQGRIIDHDLLRIHIGTDSVSQHRGVCKSFVLGLSLGASDAPYQGGTSLPLSFDGHGRTNDCGLVESLGLGFRHADASV